MRDSGSDVRWDVSSLVHPTVDRALVDPDAGWELSGEQVGQRVDGLAAQMTAAGVLPGDAVALVLEHGPGAVLAFLAVLRCNATAIPLNPQLHSHEMEELLGSRTPALVVLESDAGLPAAQAASELGVPAVTLIAARDPRLQDTPPGHVDRLPEPDADAVGLLLHTSGTTGRPKAVPLAQRNLTASARGIAAGYGLGADDVSYCLMPLFHVHGLVASTLAALGAGGAVVVPRRVRPSAVWQHGNAHRVTWFSAVPTILAKLPPRPETDDERLRFVRSCSSALAPSLWAALEERFGVPLVEAYGMTEASHQMTSNPLPPRERRPGTVGTSAGADVRILGADWEVLPAGRAGEVAVHGPGVVDGYLDNDQANAASFRDGWFRTGDLGRLSADGYLTLEGRLKELINRGGEKIAPREIDEALLAHPAVLEAVAFGRPDPKWGEVVEAVVVLGGPVTSAALRLHCSERLAGFKVPRVVHIVEQIPKGATGKIQRRVVAESLTR
jgi:acyl-CoA synthetase (AMP-forming)/AMP-acid ligase II